ncbi:uncharacterized protein SCHCODRAFT_02639817 [Schizophyllum commune H4-8]|uniref:uncharacterized protein n=1 Tax=Schizophyllum commune (strain H4-8 / FGSC 9210) TaxID=578458 RepID=UPI00216093EB|nr:uncharacterized protein SCHCODRAFT_02639817 [Schizophyllum commune H4-8]KAI5886783.1 hypothetical protein SCHCODRAFT_02639817 [Schizophyllum commune H4-8]
MATMSSSSSSLPSTSASVTPTSMPDSSLAEWEGWIAQAASAGEDELYDELDDEIAYQFKPRQQVWVRDSKGHWRLGYVRPTAPRMKAASPAQRATRRTRTRTAPPKASWFYSVIYDRKFRREFSPQKGEIKLDTPYFRRLYAERKLTGLM